MKEVAVTILAGLLVVLGVLALFSVVWGIGAVIFYVAWNLGVVNIAAAVGGSVASINFWTALGGSFAIGILKRVFSRQPAVQATKS
jgi:hypothetical protein